MSQSFWSDEAGFVVSAELVLVATICVISLVVGLSEIAVAINTELDDVANGIGALNQSYAVTFFCTWGSRTLKSVNAPSRFDDNTDDCDLTQSCDLICGIPLARTESRH